MDITQQFQGEWIDRYNKVKSSFRCTPAPATPKGAQPQASQPDTASVSKGMSGSLIEVLDAVTSTQDKLEEDETKVTSEPSESDGSKGQLEPSESEGSKGQHSSGEEKPRTTTTTDAGESQEEVGDRPEAPGAGAAPSENSNSKDQAEVQHGEGETKDTNDDNSGQPSSGTETSNGDDHAKKVDDESQPKTIEVATKDYENIEDQVVPNLDSAEEPSEESKNASIPLSGGSSVGGEAVGSKSSTPPRFHITALAVFTRKDPSSTASATGSSSSSDKSPPCSVLVTGFTAANLFSHHLVPMLLVHHVRTKNRYSSGKLKSGSLPAGVLPMGAQGGGEFYMDIMDPVPNPIHLSSSVSESESMATVDPIGAVELEEYAAEDGSHGWPKIGQILPLDGGRLLVVTCNSAGSADKPMQTSLLLFSVDPSLKINRELFFHDTIKSAHFHICPLKESSDKVLLAGVSTDGRVIVFDCSSGKLGRVCEFTCFPPDSKEEATSCTYCPTTARLLVSLKSGRVQSLKITDKDTLRTQQSTEAAGMESGLDRNLNSKDFEDILELVGVSPVGVPFTCSSHVHWKEISLLQLNRRSPLHMNMGPEVAEARQWPPNLPHRQRGNMDNSKILQYEPPLEQPMSGRLVYALDLYSQEIPCVIPTVAHRPTCYYN